jgi:hypothetical protein
MVSRLDTTTSLKVDTNPQDVNLNVTLTATVAPARGTGMPTGTVFFYDAISGTPVLLGTGKLNVVSGSDIAELQTSFANAGSHGITAVYEGDSSFGPSTGSLAETIVAPLVATQVLASVSLTQGQSLPPFTPVAGSGGIGTLTYSVAPALPAGLSLSPATGVLSGTPSVASVSTAYTVTVTDQNGATAAASFTLAVIQAGNTNAKITVTPSSSTITDQQAPTLAVAVSGSGATPTGIVTLVAGSTFVQQQLVGGVASFTVPASMLTAGSNTLTVYYSGDATYAAGSSQTTITEYPVVLNVPQMAAITHGSSGSVTATLIAGSSYKGTMDLTCVLTHSPQSATVVPTCTVTPAAVPLTPGSTGSVTITVNANVPSLVSQAKVVAPSRWTLACGSMLAALTLLLAPGKRRRVPTLMLLLTMTLGLAATVGCGSGVNAPYLPSGGAVTAGTYTFNIIGIDTANPATTTNMVTLTTTIQ